MKQKTFKNIYLVVISIATIVAVIFGCINYIPSIFSGWTWPWGDSFGFETQKDTVDVTDSFTDLIVDADVGKIIIKSGDTASVDYEYAGKKAPQVECKDGTLSVTYKSSKKVNSLFGSWSSSSQITITLPQDLTLENLDVTASVGDVTIDGVNTQNFTTEVDMGQLEINDSTIDYANAQVCMGNLVGKNITLQDIDLEVDMGNCTISGDIYGGKVKVDMGNLEVESSQSIEDMDLDMDVDMGNCQVNGKSL